jgi:DNA repair photolyase
MDQKYKINIIEARAKSILRRHKKIDSWFLTHYAINLYRGCTHNCVYCDGRAETYRIDGEFGRDITVKINAIELLRRELDPKRKRKPMPRSFVMLGGGVCDAYQPVEKRYALARKTLELLEEYNHPVHILTKSRTVMQDIDILKRINDQTKAVVSFSFSTVDENISRIFEPGVSSPSDRLAAIKTLKKAGLTCGMFLMPVIPFITDHPEMMKNTLQAGREAGVDFVIFGTMTLKTGRQKDYFINVIKEHYPELLPEYDTLYQGNSPWGETRRDYYTAANQVFDKVASVLKIPKRIHPRIFKNVVSENDLVIVLLEQLDYLLQLKGQKSPYGFAAYQLSQITEPMGTLLPGEVLKIRGVGTRTMKVIQEILDRGTCAEYEALI